MALISASYFALYCNGNLVVYFIEVFQQWELWTVTSRSYDQNDAFIQQPSKNGKCVNNGQY